MVDGTPSVVTTATVEKATRAFLLVARVRLDIDARTDGCRPTQLASFRTSTAIAVVRISKEFLQ